MPFIVGWLWRHFKTSDAYMAEKSGSKELTVPEDCAPRKILLLAM